MTSNTKKTSYHHGDLRSSLLAVARATIEQKGVERMSLRACAREIGVDVAALYRHFKTKQSVLATLAAQGFDELGESMQRAVDATDKGNARERFLAGGVAYVRYGLCSPNIYRLMFGNVFSAEIIGAHRDEASHSPSPFDVLVGLIDGMLEEGFIQPARREGAEMMCWAQVHGFVSLVLDKKSTELDLEHALARTRAHLDVLLLGLY